MTEHLFAAPQTTPEAPPAAPRQRTLDDLGTPLYEVTFVVFDIETTGGKAADGGKGGEDNSWCGWFGCFGRRRDTGDGGDGDGDGLSSRTRSNVINSHSPNTVDNSC